MLALLTDIKHTVLRIARWYTHGKKKSTVAECSRKIDRKHINVKNAVMFTTSNKSNWRL